MSENKYWHRPQRRTPPEWNMLRILQEIRAHETFPIISGAQNIFHSQLIRSWHGSVTVGGLSSTRSSLLPSCDQLCRDSHVSCFSYYSCPIVLRPYSTVGAWWIGTHYGKHLLRKGSPGGSCLARWTDRNQRAQSSTRPIKSRAVLREVWPCFIY